MTDNDDLDDAAWESDEEEGEGEEGEDVHFVHVAGIGAGVGGAGFGDGEIADFAEADLEGADLALTILPRDKPQLVIAGRQRHAGAQRLSPIRHARMLAGCAPATQPFVENCRAMPPRLPTRIE